MLMQDCFTSFKSQIDTMPTRFKHMVEYLVRRYAGVDGTDEQTGLFSAEVLPVYHQIRAWDNLIPLTRRRIILVGVYLNTYNGEPVGKTLYADEDFFINPQSFTWHCSQTYQNSKTHRMNVWCKIRKV